MRKLDLSTIKHAGRFTDIAFVLLKYGFDDVVQRLDMPGKLLLKRVSRVKEDLTTAERIRRTLEELGPTFVKFGQVISLRSDLLPAEWVFELRKLQDQVPPVDFSIMRGHLEKSLGGPLEDSFVQFDERPMAAASLAQVHRAVLRDGRQAVAVKIQRPHIRRDIDGDIAIMEALADQLDQRMEAAAMYDLPRLVQEFRKTLLHELDYVREARNMRIFRGNFQDDPFVHVPLLYEEYCTERLLVMELIDGVKLNQASPNDPQQRQELARRGLHVVVKQVLEDGFFHADPHPGNILVRDGRVLCLLDCGMVGRLTRETRYKLTALIQATVEKDIDRLLDVLLDLTGGYDRVDRRSLERDLLDLLDGYHSVPLAKLNIGSFLAEVTDALRENGLSLPQNLAVMIKALITSEGVARELDPQLNVIDEMRPIVESLIIEQRSPENIWRAVRNNLNQVLAFQKQLPNRLSQITQKLERGQLSIKFRHENLEEMHHTLEDIASRLTVAIIVASIVIGSSLIITTNVGPMLFGLPALGVVGYLFSALLGLWIVVNILRARW